MRSTSRTRCPAAAGARPPATWPVCHRAGRRAAGLAGKRLERMWTPQTTATASRPTRAWVASSRRSQGRAAHLSLRRPVQGLDLSMILPEPTHGRGPDVQSQQRQHPGPGRRAAGRVAPVMLVAGWPSGIVKATQQPNRPHDKPNYFFPGSHRPEGSQGRKPLVFGPSLERPPHVERRQVAVSAKAPTINGRGGRRFAASTGW